MKAFARQCLVVLLGWQVRRLYKKNSFKVVAVAGSIGKTSTKLAIASVLGATSKVQYQDGNYNVPVSVPLVFFGLPLPSLLNPFAWLVALTKIEAQLLRPYPYDYVVIEVGTDRPGDLAAFERFLRADVGVLTAIAPEHMEFFGNLDAVAKEELTIAKLSKQLLINTDLCESKYLQDLKSFITYGANKGVDYKLTDVAPKYVGFSFTINKKDSSLVHDKLDVTAVTQLISVTAAVGVADIFGHSQEAISKGLQQIKPVPGRLNRLRGVKNSTIIDDTYNASPDAAIAALDTLYSVNAPQKIALLGSMNELGDFSPRAHTEVGNYCDPKQLDLVITLGPDANEYLAPAAEKTGCRVVRTETPYDSAAEILKVLKEGAFILAKGSQNKVFAEEAVKLLLEDKTDAQKLVRQSPDWLRKKQTWLGGFKNKRP